MVLVPLLSFSWSGFMIGWASAPYDPRWAHANPRRAGWMSLAGPAANLILVIAAATAIRFGIAADVFFAPQTIHFTQVVGASPSGVWGTVATLLSVTFTLNLLLLVFNLIPFPPLDGSGALALLMSDDNARRMRNLTSRPQFSMLGIVAAWFLIGSVFHPIHLMAVNLLYPELGYR